MPKLQVGIAGHYPKQFSDDDSSGDSLANGNRLEKSSIGPQLFYSFDQATGAVLKWLHETNVKNGPMGDSSGSKRRCPFSNCYLYALSRRS